MKSLYSLQSAPLLMEDDVREREGTNLKNEKACISLYQLACIDLYRSIAYYRKIRDAIAVVYIYVCIYT